MNEPFYEEDQYLDFTKEELISLYKKHIIKNNSKYEKTNQKHIRTLLKALNISLKPNLPSFRHGFESVIYNYLLKGKKEFYVDFGESKFILKTKKDLITFTPNTSFDASSNLHILGSDGSDLYNLKKQLNQFFLENTNKEIEIVFSFEKMKISRATLVSFKEILDLRVYDKIKLLDYEISFIIDNLKNEPSRKKNQKDLNILFNILIILGIESKENESKYQVSNESKNLISYLKEMKIKIYAIKNKNIIGINNLSFYTEIFHTLSKIKIELGLLPRESDLHRLYKRVRDYGRSIVIRELENEN